VVRDLAQGLAHAHAHGVLHGGLNPSTVLLDAHDQASVLGLGFAATAHASDLPSMDPLVSGAAAYLAPEQLQGGDVDERTDVHALGVLLYELLAGHRAYPGDTVPDVARALMSHDPAPPHWLRLDVPERLSAIAMQALQRNPAARYMHASQVAAALCVWLDQCEADTDEAREYFVNAQAQPKPGPKKRHWISAVLLAATAVVVAFTWVDRSEQSSAAADSQASTAAVAPAAAGEVRTVDHAGEATGATAVLASTPGAAVSDASAASLAGANAGVQHAAPLPAQSAASAKPADAAAEPAAPNTGTGTPGPGATTDLPAGAAQAHTAMPPATAALPVPVPVAQVVPAVVPAAGPLAPARPAVKPQATRPEVASPPQAGKALARDKSKATGSDARAVAPAAVQTGTVQLAVSPWGYVEVGGKPAGASPPLRKLTLPEGTHTITIRNEDFAPYTTTVQVSAEKAATVRHRFPQ
jgi:serine/threonine-protein kinase